MATYQRAELRVDWLPVLQLGGLHRHGRRLRVVARAHAGEAASSHAAGEGGGFRLKAWVDFFLGQPP